MSEYNDVEPWSCKRKAILVDYDEHSEDAESHDVDGDRVNDKRARLLRSAWVRSGVTGVHATNTELAASDAHSSRKER
ncbi:hypothetical protein E4U39_002127 [Claviceps sp. Clav50 group G5]|nr:hypothetical protein E4U39_002127 [Claviceps sp. Clav50 group G5]